MLQDVRVLFFLVVLVTARGKLTVIISRRSVFFPIRYHTIERESDWPLCVMWAFRVVGHGIPPLCCVLHVRAGFSLILDIRPPARPGVPLSWCAGGDETQSPRELRKNRGFAAPNPVFPAKSANILPRADARKYIRILGLAQISQNAEIPPLLFCEAKLATTSPVWRLGTSNSDLVVLEPQNLIGFNGTERGGGVNFSRPT